jgi:phospholipid/cholesterol/gamma-HCH transport system substrate-binding protein
MREQLVETILGAIVAAVAIGFFAFAFNQSGAAAGAADANGYYARFQRVDGIAVGSDVRLSGVKVGVVTSVSLDPDTYAARLGLTVDKNVELLDATVASIRSDGLLGGAYVALEPAGIEVLAPGDEIINTQGSQDLLTLLLSAAQQMGGGGGGGEAETQMETTP